MIAPTPFRPQPVTRRGGFTMTELMVVIGIIAVLAGILLTAMRGVRNKAMQTQTMYTMQDFSKAADAFQMVHSRYPGVLPEGILAATSFSGGVSQRNGGNGPDGMSAAVTTATTPGSASAAPASIPRIAACANGLRTNTA